MTIINTTNGGGAKTIAGEEKPSSFPSTYPAPEGYDGWSKLTIDAPDNLSADNIKKDVEIAGVTGTYEPSLATQEGTVTEFPMTYTTPEGFYGMSTVIAHAPETLVAGNIKKGVEVANITGTYEPALQMKGTKATSFPVVVEPDSDYYGLEQATVTAPDDLVPENIGTGKTIAGVEGTYTSPVTEFSFYVDARPNGWNIADYTEYKDYAGWNTIKVEGIQGLRDVSVTTVSDTSVKVYPGTTIGQYENWQTMESYGWVNVYDSYTDMSSGYTDFSVPLADPTESDEPVPGTIRNRLWAYANLDVTTGTIDKYNTGSYTMYLCSPGDNRKDNHVMCTRVRGGRNVMAYVNIGPGPWYDSYVYEGDAPNVVTYTFTQVKGETFYKPDLSGDVECEFNQYWGAYLKGLFSFSGDIELDCAIRYVPQLYASISGVSPDPVPMPQVSYLAGATGRGYDGVVSSDSLLFDDVEVSKKSLVGGKYNGTVFGDSVCKLRYYDATNKWTLVCPANILIPDSEQFTTSLLNAMVPSATTTPTITKFKAHIDIVSLSVRIP